MQITISPEVFVDSNGETTYKQVIKLNSDHKDNISVMEKEISIKRNTMEQTKYFY
jgi:hypothetical protein